MADRKLLTTTLSEFAATLVAGHAVSDVLHDLAGRVSAVAGIPGVGVYLHVDGALSFVTGLDALATAVPRAEECEPAGPCAAACRCGELVIVADLAARHRWPGYARALLQAGVVAVAGVPMHLAGQRIGALGLYSSRRRDWPGDDLDAVRVLADFAAGYVISAARLDRSHRLGEQLQQALDSRILIEQAKGIVSAERGISVDKAFERLRRHARNRNATLRSVAEAVVSLGLRPLPGPPGIRGPSRAASAQGPSRPSGAAGRSRPRSSTSGTNSSR